jgi:hypothetical protein
MYASLKDLHDAFIVAHALPFVQRLSFIIMIPGSLLKRFKPGIIEKFMSY